jgi:D-alanyl-D-alanine carboxypeptidase/D-alanyl-D-alanine-endopeptidase (penicillin-binding protein 4)
MRRFLTAGVVAAITVVSSAPSASATTPVASLSRSLDAILSTSGATALSVRVDVAGRGTVFSHSPAKALNPASTQKVITAYTALKVLGPAHRFVTKVGATAAPDRNGVVHGRLVVTAGGDPTLTKAGLASLADQLHRQGVRTVTGGIVLDDSMFGRVRRAAGWKNEWVPSEVGPLSAFALGGNRFRHDAGYLSNPTVGNLQVLQQVFGQRGVVVRGHFTIARPATTPRPLAAVYSPQLVAIVHDLLKNSVNFEAEMLLEAIGATRGHGTPAGGVAVVRQVAKQLHVNLGGNIEDGSGLSLLDRESANGEVAWLQAVRADPVLGPVIFAALPIGCVDGTLRARVLLCGMANPVHAKTGTLDTMRALSGYVIDAAGHRVTFAFLVQGPLSSGARGKAAIDHAVRALAASHV